MLRPSALFHLSSSSPRNPIPVVDKWASCAMSLVQPFTINFSGLALANRVSLTLMRA